MSIEDLLAGLLGPNFGQREAEHPLRLHDNPMPLHGEEPWQPPQLPGNPAVVPKRGMDILSGAGGDNTLIGQGGNLPPPPPLQTNWDEVMPPGATSTVGRGLGLGLGGAAPRPAPPMPPPGFMPPGGGGGPAESGGIESALGVARPQIDPMQRISRSLASGLQSVKNSPFKGEVIAQSVGGAMSGGNKYEDEETARAQKQYEADRAHKIKEGTLGVARSRASTDANYKDGLLSRGKFNFFPGTGRDADGKEVPGIYTVNNLDGTKTFEPGGTIGSRVGGGAAQRDFAFDRRRAAIRQLYGEGSQEEKDFVGGKRQMSPAEALKWGYTQAESELKNDPRSMGLKPEERKKRKEERARQLADGLIQSAPAAAPAAAPPPGSPSPAPAPAAKSFSFKGSGTSQAPFQVKDANDYAEMPAGSYYQHPKDPPGKLRIKGEE